MKHMYLFTTGAIFCSDKPIPFCMKYTAKEGLLSVTGNPDRFVRVKDFEFSHRNLIASWIEE